MDHQTRLTVHSHRNYRRGERALRSGRMKQDLFIGVTSWNSELFLEHCLRSIQRTTDGMRCRVAVMDNHSEDRSVKIARDMGAEVYVEHCSQSIALNRLLS